jgi:hypothetical protein
MAWSQKARLASALKRSHDRGSNLSVVKSIAATKLRRAGKTSGLTKLTGRPSRGHMAPGEFSRLRAFSKKLDAERAIRARVSWSG